MMHRFNIHLKALVEHPVESVDNSEDPQPTASTGDNQQAAALFILKAIKGRKDANSECHEWIVEKCYRFYTHLYNFTLYNIFFSIF